MSMRFGKPALIFAVALVFALVWGAPALAQATTGEGPFDAMTPTGEWTELQSGEYDWYVIHFDYDEGEVQQPFEIKMYAEPYASATLTVRNQDQVDKWINDGEHLHFGCCTMTDKDRDFDGKPDYAQWAGALRASGNYYIVVEHAKNMTEPAYYRFTVSGDDLSFPQMEAAPLTMAAPVPDVLPTAPEVVVSTETPQLTAAPAVEAKLLGTGPDYAMQPTGEWTELESAGYHWYKFIYDEDKDWTKPVTIRLYSDPLDGAIATVRNGDQAELWRQEGEHKHFGCCVRPEVTTQVKTDDEEEEDGLVSETEKLDYAIWSADLTASGVYYIVVEHAENSTEPAFYRFDIEGDGVGF